MQDKLAMLPGAPRGHPDQLVRGRLLELELLHVFVTVALCGGFTAAASLLNRTQAAVSIQIKRLEDIVQAHLLERTSRGVELTPRGFILLDYARNMIRLNEEVLLKLHSEVLAGPVRMGVFAHFATHILPSILAEFSDIYPDVWVELDVGGSAEMSVRADTGFDVVISFAESGQARGHVLRREAVSWYSSPRHRQHEREPLPVALMSPDALFHAWALRSLTDLGRPWRVAQTCTNAGAIEAAVAAGLAVGVFKEGTVGTDMIKPIGPESGFPALPDVDVTIRTEGNFVSAAARRLSEFIISAVSTREATPPEKRGGSHPLV